jgi:hypothetical protein
MFDFVVTFNIEYRKVSQVNTQCDTSSEIVLVIVFIAGHHLGFLGRAPHMCTRWWAKCIAMHFAVEKYLLTS